MRSVRTELTLRLLIGSYLLMLAAGSFLYFHLTDRLIEQFDARLQETALVLSDEFEFQGDGFDFDPGAATVARFESGPRPEYFQFLSPLGRSIIRSPSLAEGDLAWPSLEHEPAFFDTQLPDGRQGRAIALSFLPTLDEDDYQPQPGEVTPLTVLLYASGRESLDEMLRSLWISLGFLGIFLPLGTTLLVRYVVRQGLAPLQSLAEKIQDIEPDRLDQLMPGRDLPAELRPLVGRLNDLMQRVQSTVERERRFASNISHEFRTPLAELRTLTEVGLSALGKEDSVAAQSGNPISCSQVLQDSRDIGLRMERMLEALLALARSEAGIQPLEQDRIDLVALIRNVFQSYSTKFLDKGISVRFRMPESLILQADRALLAAIVANLLENAACHAPPGSWFKCCLDLQEKQIRLLLSNPMSELEQTDQSRLFEPFGSRGTGHNGEHHAGLGLALVRAYLRSLDGQMTPDLNAGIFSISVELPRRTDKAKAMPSPKIPRQPAHRWPPTPASDSKSPR